VVIDDKGTPICCEMWPGNTADVKALVPVMERLRKRFHISRMCIVADRGMISKETLDYLESQESPIPYIIGTRMRKAKEIREHILTDPGPYREVYPESDISYAPSPLKVKEVFFNERRYIVCVNSKQARKDAKTRETIIESLKEKLQKGPKKLIGNKGYRKFLKVEKGSVHIDSEKIKVEARYDGKWVLQTGNMECSAEHAALKYKELWQVERIFRDAKTLLETRPVFHQKNENIRGHVFCSFLALVLRKELDRRLSEKGHEFEWARIKQDLKALQFVTIEQDGKRFMIRSRCEGDCAKIFHAVGVAIPSSIREI
jgi:transposase